MALRQYLCAACQHTFETLERWNSPAPKECPSCNSSEVHKIMSGGAFVLKGEGFYKPSL